MQLHTSSFKLDELTTETPVEALQSWLVKQLTEQLSLDAATIKVSEPLTRYGLDSIDAVTLVGDLEDWLGLELPDTLFWDYQSIEKASQYLVENYDIADALDKQQAVETSDIEPPLAEAASGDNKGWGNLWGRFK